MSDMQSTTYTEQDFADAEFARHPDGRITARNGPKYGPWQTKARYVTDADMAEEGWVPVREAEPIDLDALQAAWENAEEGHATKGDVIIRRALDGEDFAVWVSVWSGWTEEGVRILRRAPKPKRPECAEVLEALIVEWSGLALLDDWDDLTWVGKPALLADWLAERGVRVTEGGEGR